MKRVFDKHLKALTAAAILLLLLCGCSEARPPQQINQGSFTELDPETTCPALPPEEASPAPTQLPEPEPTEPVEATEPPEITPEPRAERVEDDYFADAAFFGNSLVDGLHSFGGLAYGDFFAGTSASVLSVETVRDAKLSNGSPATMLEALLEKQYGKIYVMLGINELGFNSDSFVELYTALLNTISEAEPDAEICVMSLTPITKARSDGPDLFTRDKVMEFNAGIRRMAKEQGYTFIDLFSAFADEDGWLPPEKSSDGVHFKFEIYPEWAEYLRTHYDGSPET